MSFDLYYWPFIPGRGEYVRLVLEAARAPYRDVARLPESEGGGVGAIAAFLEDEGHGRIPFAPPFLKDGAAVVAQTALICAHLGEKLELAPTGEAERLFARQIALTTADFVAEAHDVHHPIASGLYYQDQKEAAREAAKAFREERMPKFLGWYEKLIDRNPADSGHLVGDRLSYADLGLFQTWEGLTYAFPKRMRAIGGEFPKARRLADLVSSEPAVAGYLASPRRMAFNEDGIFRHYPELDAD